MVKGTPGIPELWAVGPSSPSTIGYARIRLPIHHCDNPEMFWTITFMHAKIMLDDLVLDEGVPISEIKWEVRTPVILARSDD